MSYQWMCTLMQISVQHVFPSKGSPSSGPSASGWVHKFRGFAGHKHPYKFLPDLGPGRSDFLVVPFDLLLGQRSLWSRSVRVSNTLLANGGLQLAGTLGALDQNVCGG